MNKVYLVEAHFFDSDESWITNIGTFSDKDVAERVKEKWEEFFESNISLFEKPVGFDGQNWTETKEFDDILNNFQDILGFEQITLTELHLNNEYIIENMYHNSDKLTGLMKQFDIEYKIENIIG